MGLEYADAARKAQLRLAEEQHSQDITLALNDPNHFCEWCFRDDQFDTPLIQGWHHRQWQKHVWDHDRCVIWFPIEHGKTTQAKMTLCRLLGMHPDRQYAYISSKDKQARKVLGSVKREIESNTRLQMCYPDLKPQISAISKAREEWGNTSIRVDGCPPGAKDASLTAFGVDGQILGSRLHGAILDNVLDKKNTRSQDLREWIHEIIQDEIIGRVMKGGFLWVLDTAWFADDALHQLAKKERWFSIKFDAEVGEVEGETLWPEQWPEARLAETKAELGPTAYDRQFRNMPLSESQDWFKREFWDASYGRCTVVEEWHEGDLVPEELVTGIDLATRKGESHDLTAFATMSTRGHRRQLLNMQSDHMEGTAILRRIAFIYRTLHRPVSLAGGYARFVVEDNAAQVYIVQMLRDAEMLSAIGLTTDEAADINVTGRTTTSKRRDAELGVQGLVSAIEMGRWDFAPCQEVRNLREEMKVWSPEANHYGDRLMALWIGASSINETVGGFKVDFLE
jgi:hypothetical protein